MHFAVGPDLKIVPSCEGLASCRHDAIWITERFFPTGWSKRTMFDSDANRGRDPEPVDPNIRSMTRVALLGGFSLLLALLWPRELFPVMLAGFLFINALMSAFAAAIQRQPVWSRTFTRWDEAAAFYVFGFLAGLFIDPAVMEEAMKASGMQG
jgi:hypothetical protein